MKKSKNKELTITEDVLDDENSLEDQLIVSEAEKHHAVSIIPKLKNNRIIYEIVRFSYNDVGECSDKETLHSSINEHTAMTLLFQAAHETFSVKNLRKQIKTLKGVK